MFLNQKRIFIVEDDMRNRIVYKMILQNTHKAILEFDRWGADGMAHLEKFAPVDLIVLDLMFLMGGISGYEVFDQIKAREEFAHVPIVAVSAAEPSSAMAKTQQKGFNGFIAKPVEDELFAEQLADLIAGKEVWYAGERFAGAQR
ncbi:MAG: response regulator [Anaerolineae bacterium]|nr:response regulator [Anaerolineae bacterium]